MRLLGEKVQVEKILDRKKVRTEYFFMKARNQSSQKEGVINCC